MNVAAEDSLRRSESALRPSLDDVLVGDGALLLRRDEGNGRVLPGEVPLLEGIHARSLLCRSS